MSRASSISNVSTHAADMATGRFNADANHYAHTSARTKSKSPIKPLFKLTKILATGAYKKTSAFVQTKAEASSYDFIRNHSRGLGITAGGTASVLVVGVMGATGYGIYRLSQMNKDSGNTSNSPPASSKPKSGKKDVPDSQTLSFLQQRPAA